jgi:hypothetical protein
MKMLLSLIPLLCLLPLAVAAADAPKSRVFHVVAFKYKESVTEAQKQEIQDAFAALKKSIPQILSLDYGKNISPEGFNQGFTHAWVLTFANEKDRDAYLVHPEHKKFGKMLGGKLAEKGVFVVDFESKQ